MNKFSAYMKDLLAFKYLKAFLYILIFLGIGETIQYFTGIPIPGNVLGMLLLFLALKEKVLKLEDVKPASDKLLEFLVLFFVPYGVGLMVHFDLIAGFWIPMSVAVIISTLSTLYVTAVVIEKFGK